VSANSDDGSQSVRREVRTMQKSHGFQWTMTLSPSFDYKKVYDRGLEHEPNGDCDCSETDPKEALKKRPTVKNQKKMAQAMMTCTCPHTSRRASQALEVMTVLDTRKPPPLMPAHGKGRNRHGNESNQIHISNKNLLFVIYIYNSLIY
jgi:hypothetical protein